jgi:hypothetical protein
MAQTYHRIDEHAVERIEGTVNMKALESFKESTNKIIEDMFDEGYDMEDIKDYLFQEIENKIDTKIEESENDN